MSTTLAAALIVGLSVQTGTLADPPPMGPFVCRLDGSTLTLTADADGSRYSGNLGRAGAFFGNEVPKRTSLRAAYDGMRYVYTNPDITMVITGDTARLHGSFGVSDCAATPVETDDGATGETSEIGTAITWGGNVRSGPGLDFARSAGVPMGVEVTLLARSDAEPWLDQYPWFRVRLPSGQEGYIAGGLLCSREGRSGMFNDRDCEG